MFDLRVDPEKLHQKYNLFVFMFDLRVDPKKK